MKSYTRFILAAMLFAAPCWISAQTTVGYTNSNANRTHGVRFGTGSTQGIAIRISKEKAQLLKGTKIQSIEAIFSTSHTNDLKFFISKSLETNPEYTQAESKSSTRWKSYPLNTPYLIDGEAFYIGYTCEVTETYKPHLFDESQDFGNALIWAINEGKWEDISNKGYGGANLRFVTDATSSISDLTMKSVKANGFYKVGKGYEFEGQLFNFGNTPIQSFDLTCQVGTSAPSTYKVKNANIAPGTTYDFKMPEYFPTVNGKVPFKVSVSNINGTNDADLSDNESTTSTYIYPEDAVKKVLVENFTGQACSNCPNGHKAFNKAIQGKEENFIEVAHHAGYQLDAFTMKEDMMYTWFYNNNGSTYAPASMFDRTMVHDGMGSVLFETQDVNTLNEAISKSIDAEPYVIVNLSNDYDETNRKSKITVKVHTYVTPSDRDHRLNLFLTQDNIVSYQSGAGSNYVHNHVFRGAINGTWGESIKLEEGTTLVKTFEYTLPEEILSTESNAKIKAIPEDMHLVAFVSDAAESALECKVYNAATIHLVDDGITGISSTTTNTPLLQQNGNAIQLKGSYLYADVFSLQGKKMGRLKAEAALVLPRGLYLVRMTLTDNSQLTEKIYVR